MNIAVTATGGGVGQSIIKALQPYSHKIIALDSEPLGAGLYMADEGFIIPYADSDDYISALCEICKRERVDILFPGMDIELPILSKNKQLIEKEAGTHVVVSDLNVIDIADDKLKTARFLENNGFPFPKTHQLLELIIDDDVDPFYPTVLKPMKGGARSKGVFKVSSPAEFIDISRNVVKSDYVFQELIEGDEYTCGTVTLNGKYYGCIVMRRILRDGDTYKAFVEKNEVIEKLCADVCGILKPEGSLNIQLRMKGGVPYIFEFNARCSGTTAARALAGFNEPMIIAEYLSTGKEWGYDIKGITILRYWNELVVQNDSIINR